MARYSFLTAWMLDAPLEAVWEAIYGIERWPEWWRGVEDRWNHHVVMHQGGEGLAGLLGARLIAVT